MTPSKHPIALGLVGCGVMGRRHVLGLKELKERGFQAFELEALCDLDVHRAEELALVCESHLGRRPKVFGDLEKMLSELPSLEAIDLVTSPKTHHTLAKLALEAGLDVIVEKPIALTIRAARLMVEEARSQGRVLAVAENYRRDPQNRLVKAVIESGMLGKPYLVIQQSVGGGNEILITPWRHLKNEGGILIDMGVHYADLLRYIIGEVEEVYGFIALKEKERVRREGCLIVERVYATAEDTALGILRFEGGAFGQWTEVHGAWGEALWQRIIYCDKGSLKAPPDRSGKPLEARGIRESLGNEAFMNIADKALDNITRRLFPGYGLSYEMPFEQIDRKLIAIELYDFAESIRYRRKPEVDGLEGLKDLALSYALCEAAMAGRPVAPREVEEGLVEAYQESINKALGL
ncbi:Gfo/Idh/MocA family oxidoreductase [Candidatus Bathyarchaeota archaeon]|nr:Gfo/Idh/MocA family oxidoreductase [Candidatus Bathyarchaeota archaeon]MBS7627556.1 Gfo/Idh/MocA family oxidoreductase [Candidatus Bathyarchaeota archaeon]